MDEMKIKEQLIEYAVFLEERKFVNALEGNISILDRETGLMYITPSGTRKATLRPEDIAVMKGDEQVGGEKKRSSEYLLHKAVYEAREDVCAVVHTHAPFLSAYAFCGKGVDLKCSTTFAALHTDIPCLPYGEPGSIDITNGIAEAIQGHSTVLLANHGVVTAAKSLPLACYVLESTEAVLEIYEKAKVMGVSNLTEDELAHYRKSRKEMKK